MLEGSSLVLFSRYLQTNWLEVWAAVILTIT